MSKMESVGCTIARLRRARTYIGQIQWVLPCLLRTRPWRPHRSASRSRTARACASSAGTAATTRAGFAGIAAAVAALPARSLVLDGEVAIYDQRLRSKRAPVQLW